MINISKETFEESLGEIGVLIIKRGIFEKALMHKIRGIEIDNKTYLSWFQELIPVNDPQLEKAYQEILDSMEPNPEPKAMAQILFLIWNYAFKKEAKKSGVSVPKISADYLEKELPKWIWKRGQRREIVLGKKEGEWLEGFVKMLRSFHYVAGREFIEKEVLPYTYPLLAIHIILNSFIQNL